MPHLTHNMRAPYSFLPSLNNFHHILFYDYYLLSYQAPSCHVILRRLMIHFSNSVVYIVIKKYQSVPPVEGTIQNCGDKTADKIGMHSVEV